MSKVNVGQVRRPFLSTVGRVTYNALCVASVVAVIIAATNRFVGGEMAVQQGYNVGDQIPAEAPISQTSKTVLLFVRSGCQFCTESMGFYRHLAESAAVVKPPVRIVAISSDSVEALRKYLESHGVHVDEFVSSTGKDGAFARVRGTPTVVVATRARLVESVWLGKQTVAGEQAILASVTGM